MPVVNGVSENGDVTKPLMDTSIEMAPIEVSASDKRTRFQVNKVNAPEGTDRSIQITVSEDCQDDEDEREDNDNLLPVHDRTRLNSDTAASTDTKYAKSFRHFTREALPRLDNYRNIMSIQAAYRPTLDELHNATLPTKAGNVAAAKGGQPDQEVQQVKFGWIQGVLVRCLLNIWGVMLFLRLSWVVGQAGVGQAVLLILTTTAVTTITALSMSAISTNGVIKGGGTYYMISRSLGPEFGGSIGLIFSLANAVACAMYVVGFCESMTDLLGSFGLYIVDGDVQDVRIIGSITIVLLTVLVVVGMEWEAKTQLGLLVILLVAIVDFLIGSFIGPTSDEAQAKGFVGYNYTLLKENFFPDYRLSEGVEHSFFSVFAIFFPAATGILAGANISGDLRDPQGAIPKGTLLAIVLTTASYLIMAVISGATVTRDATGNVDDFLNGTFTNCTIGECKYGLQNSFQVIELVSWVGPVIYAGCFAATLSSALASLVSAPKVFQALCKDKLYPYIEWFGRGYGQNNEPVRGYVLTFFIAIAFILIGELNLIAPLISNFFLAAYTLINFSTFHASLAKPVGWRPTFKYYNMWLSLLGSILCVGVMFLISWWTALLTLSVVLALYLIVAYQKPDVNWGSTTQAQTYKTALSSVQQLNSVEEHVKNYRPQILVLTGMPSARPPLIDFAYLLTKNLSLLICGHIKENLLSQRVRTVINYKANSWLKAHKVKAFYSLVDGVNFEEGAKAMLQASGIGKLRPNILLMGFKSDWQKGTKDSLNMYFEVLHKALDMHISVGILRLQNGLDYSNLMLEEDGQINEQSILATRTRNNSTESLPRNQSYTQMSQVFPLPSQLPVTQVPQPASSVSDVSVPASPVAQNKQSVNPSPNADSDSVSTKKKKQSNQGSKSDVYQSKGSTDFPKDVMHQINQFQRKQKKGTIDVWWLYDDGGLTLLLPYIISTRRNWSNCKLRVFALANKQDELEIEHRNMASLLAKFRIDYSDLRVIPDITRKPQDETQTFFDNLVAELTNPEDADDTESAPIPESELLAMKEKTNRHLRLRELLLEHSSDASLIVMTLPMPRKNMISAPLYMAWLELLTKDMPPFLLVRGNQTSVLTFYS